MRVRRAKENDVEVLAEILIAAFLEYHVPHIPEPVDTRFNGKQFENPRNNLDG